jgi:hypothetical protein
MGSSSPALSPKRTNGAIEASTMRSALETTHVRERRPTVVVFKHRR